MALEKENEQIKDAVTVKINKKREKENDQKTIKTKTD